MSTVINVPKTETGFPLGMVERTDGGFFRASHRHSCVSVGPVFSIIRADAYARCGLWIQDAPTPAQVERAANALRQHRAEKAVSNG